MEYKKLIKDDNQYPIKKSEINRIEDILYKMKEKKQLITDNEILIISKIFQDVAFRGILPKKEL